MVSDVVDGSLAPSDEATNRGKALTEGPHDEIYLVGQAEVVADTTSMVA